MFSDELEMLIDAAIADGEISEKERAILHKRAQAEGVDPDELDMIVDARIAKAKNSQEDKDDEVVEETNEESTLKFMLEKINELENDHYEDELDEKGKIKHHASVIKNKTVRNYINSFSLPTERKYLKEIIVYLKSQSKFFGGNVVYRESFRDKLKETREIVKNYFPNDDELLILVGLKEDPEKANQPKKGLFGGLFGKKK